MKPKTPKQKAARLKTPPRIGDGVNWEAQRKKRERFEDRLVGALEGMAQAFAGIAEGVKAHGKGTARQAKATEAMCDKAVAMIEKMEERGAFGRSNADVDPDAEEIPERPGWLPDTEEG